MTDITKLTGSWELNYISGPRISFDGLYSNKKPYITFDLTSMLVAGNTSCNSYTGRLNVNGGKISFIEPMALTKMMCADANGEKFFLQVLKTVRTWSVTDDTTLNFMAGDIAVMRFTKK